MKQLMPLSITDPQRLDALAKKYSTFRASNNASNKSTVMHQARKFQRALMAIYLQDMEPETRARALKTLAQLDKQDMDARIDRATRGL